VLTLADGLQHANTTGSGLSNGGAGKARSDKGGLLPKFAPLSSAEMESENSLPIVTTTVRRKEPVGGKAIGFRFCEKARPWCPTGLLSQLGSGRPEPPAGWGSAHADVDADPGLAAIFRSRIM